MAWKSENECVESESECVLLKKINPTVYFREEVAHKIKFMCKKFTSLEWMAGLIGEEISPKNYCVTDIKLIDQEVTGAHVEATPKGRKQLAAIKGCVGWIHSHNTMASFQSGTDVSTAGNFPVTVTVNNAMDFTGMIKFKLNCKHAENTEIIKKATVFVENQEYNFPELDKEADEMVKEKTYIKVADEDEWTDPRGGSQQTLNQKDFSRRYSNFKGKVCTVCHQKVGKKHLAFCENCSSPAHEKCLSPNGFCKECLVEDKNWKEAEKFVGIA